MILVYSILIFCVRVTILILGFKPTPSHTEQLQHMESPYSNIVLPKVASFSLGESEHLIFELFDPNISALRGSLKSMHITEDVSCSNPGLHQILRDILSNGKKILRVTILILGFKPTPSHTEQLHHMGVVM